MSCDDVTRAQALLDLARQQLAAAEQRHRDAKTACSSAIDTWIDGGGRGRLSAEHKAANMAATAWQTAHEALCDARREVSACEVDLATARRYSTGSAA